MSYSAAFGTELNAVGGFDILSVDDEQVNGSVNLFGVDSHAFADS